MNEKRLAQLEEALARMGHTHTLEDVVAMISDGRMQSFIHGETWAVTEIIDLPQRRVLQIFLVVGDMDDAIVLHDTVLAYAKAHRCNLLRTMARDGWGKWAKDRGWTNGARIYLKDL